MQVTVYNIMTALHFVNHLYGYIILMCGTDVISIYIFIQFMEIYQYLWMNRQSLMAILLDNLLENYASTVKTGNRDILYFKGGWCL